MLQKRMVIHAFHLVDRQLYCHPIERLSILFRSELLVCGSSTLCIHHDATNIVCLTLNPVSTSAIRSVLSTRLHGTLY